MKIIPQIDTYPGLVRFCQTFWGKVVLVAAFAGALLLNQVSQWIALTAAAAAITFFPTRRKPILSLAALGFLVFDHSWLHLEFARSIASAEGQRADWPLSLMAALTVTATFCGIAIFFSYLRARHHSFVARHPVLVLVGVYSSGLAIASTLPLHGIARVALWLWVSVLSAYLWYFAYALTDATSKTPDPLYVQFGFSRPVWMMASGSFTPVGKGATWLRKVEARTAGEFSVVQLKAIKLLIWIFVLQRLRALMDIFVYRQLSSRLLDHVFHTHLPTLHIPSLTAAYAQTAAGIRLPLPLAWECAAANFIRNLLGTCIGANLAVACCRMAGFRALRNTYRPFRAETILDFWNRYSYYFKELLVDFFFFPCYLRFFKRHPRLRIFAATIAAASVGNLLVHFIRVYPYFAEVGFPRAVAGFGVYAFYSAILGISIGISQLRHQRKRAKLPVIRRLFASATVILFFALSEAFNPDDKVYSFSVHCHFMWNMFHV